MSIGGDASNQADGAAPLAQRLFDLASGFRVAQVVYVAAKLGIVDVLAEAPRTSQEVAYACDADAISIGWVLEVLREEGVLGRSDEGYYCTALGELLHSRHPARLQSWALHLGEEVYRAWGACLHTVRTGQAAFDHTFGTGWWRFLEANPDRAEHLAEAMAGTAVPLSELLVSNYDLSGVRHIVDVGGGSGDTCAALLRAYPHLRATVFDTPATAARARDRLAIEGLRDRCEAVDGDFFDTVPAGADLYLLCRVLSDWNDHDALKILRTCCAALHSGARLLVVAGLGDEPVRPAMLDLHLRLLMGGQERDLAHYRALLSRAGLATTRVIETSESGLALIEASRGNTEHPVRSNTLRSLPDHRPDLEVNIVNASPAPHVVCVSGSLGASRSNRIALWCAEFAERSDARTTVFYGQDIEFPIYRPGDCAIGYPGVGAFLSALADADGVVFVSPTYHGTVSGLFKNALDYANELAGDVRPYLDGRAAGCVAVGAGEQGATTTIATLRTVCHALRAWPTPLAVTVAGSQVGNGDEVASEGTLERLALLMSQVLFLAKPSARRRQRATDRPGESMTR